MFGNSWDNSYIQFSGDNNLVLFHLWWSKSCQRVEKSENISWLVERALERSFHQIFLQYWYTELLLLNVPIKTNFRSTKLFWVSQYPKFSKKAFKQDMVSSYGKNMKDYKNLQMQKTKIPRKGLRFDRYLSLISTTSFLIIFLKISLTTLIKGDLIEAALILKYSSGFK